MTEDSSGIAAAKGFYERHKIRHLNAYADVTGAIPSLLHARGLPTTYLIDPHGNEVGYVEGDVDWSAAEVVAFLKQKTGKPL